MPRRSAGVSSAAPMIPRWSLQRTRRLEKCEFASGRSPDWGNEESRLTAETKKVESIGNRPHPGLARAQVVPRCEIYGLEPARKAPRLEQQLHVGRPTVAGDDRLVTHRLQQLSEHRDAI